MSDNRWYRDGVQKNRRAFLRLLPKVWSSRSPCGFKLPASCTTSQSTALYFGRPNGARRKSSERRFAIQYSSLPRLGQSCCSYHDDSLSIGDVFSAMELGTCLRYGSTTTNRSGKSGSRANDHHGIIGILAFVMRSAGG